MSDLVRVLGFAGSLRRGSYNRALLAACVELALEGMEVAKVALDTLPLFNADVEADGDPQPVAELKRAVAAADGLLVVTPEYNAGLPAVTKNAIDWLSRPARDSVLIGRPSAVLGATPGRLGTARAQAQLRQSLADVGSPCLAQPQMLVARVRDLVDDDGRLADERTRERLARFLTAFEGWIRHLRGTAP